MKSIMLTSKTRGTHEMFYDDEDHDLVMSRHWMLEKSNHTFYAYAQKSKGSSSTKRICQTWKFHREVMNASDDYVDHKDGNGLNNCKSNLRLCTQQQNLRNRRKCINNRCGYKGVSFHRQMGLYRARVSVDQKQVFYRYFKTAIDAARAYNEAAIRHFGEFAKLNLI